ncbi:Fluconazole resistance protein 1 [Ciborinia camelliae]|nr:Fluconazole resistance protein 1 [Ciborinia camelliae]
MATSNLTHSNGMKSPEFPKQVSRKRKMEHSSLTSRPENSRKHKRATRACERCRNKKIKCESSGSVVCNACIDANTICQVGNGKHAEDKTYPPGHIESLENDNQTMSLVIDKLYRMVRAREEWTLAEPQVKDEGKGPVVIHDVAHILGCIRNASGLPESFGEDAPAQLTRLSEEKSKIRQEMTMENTTFAQEDSPKFPMESPAEPPAVDSTNQIFPPLGCHFDSPNPFDDLEFPLLSNIQPQVPMSKSLSMNQIPDDSKISHQPLIRSASMDQTANFNMSHAMNYAGVMDNRRAPGLNIQPQPYYYQEQSTLSASYAASSASPAHQQAPPSASYAASSASPAHQQTRPSASYAASSASASPAHQQSRPSASSLAHQQTRPSASYAASSASASPAHQQSRPSASSLAHQQTRPSASYAASSASASPAHQQSRPSASSLAHQQTRPSASYAASSASPAHQQAPPSASHAASLASPAHQQAPPSASSPMHFSNSPQTLQTNPPEDSPLSHFTPQGQPDAFFSPAPPIGEDFMALYNPELEALFDAPGVGPVGFEFSVAA